MGVRVREKTKGSGIYWVFIHHNGKRKAKKIGKEETANEIAEKIKAQLTLGRFNLLPLKAKPECPTFKDYSEKWLAFIMAKRRESTYERYAQVLRDHVMPSFGKKALDSVTRGDVRDFLVAKSAKFDVALFRDVLSGVLGFAVDDEIIKVNPVTGVTKKLDLRRDRSKDVDPFTEADLNLFLDTCQGLVPEYYPFFLMAARTGMRMGELLAVRWGDVQFRHRVTLDDGSTEERPFIWVRRSYRRGRLTAPKNGKSRRVDISNQLKAVLKEHRAREMEKALKQGLGEPPELVFHKHRRIIEQNYMRRVFKRILRKAGLRDIKFHGLRHTFASLLLSMGESPVYVKEQLGHSSIQITVDIYGKWIQTKKEAGVNRLDSTTKRNPAATDPQKTCLTVSNH
jgi:integrase